MLNQRPAEREFYNALPEADPTLFPDDDQPEMEEEADPVKEAEKLAEKAKAASIFFDDAPSIGQDEGTRQAEPSSSNQVPLLDFHDFRARLERLEGHAESLKQGQLTLQQELKRLDDGQALVLKNQETIMQQLAQLLNVGGIDLTSYL